MVYLHILLAVALFAATTYGAIAIGTRVCRTIEPFNDGPAAATPPIWLMYLCASAVAVALGIHGVDLATVGATAVMNGCLIGSWYCDVRCGIVPDWFTVPPIVVLAIFAVCAHQTLTLEIATLLFLTFAFQAWRSQGLALGWGDVKLVTFGGLLLGPLALISTMLSCIAMVIAAKAMNRMREPMAFAPYLVAGYEIGLLFFGGFR